MEVIAGKFDFRFLDSSLQPSYSHKVIVTCDAQSEIKQRKQLMRG